MSPNTWIKERFDNTSHYYQDFSERTNASRVEITETDSSYHFELKMPGYVKSDFNFYIIKNDLIVTTEKSEVSETNEIDDNKISKHSYCYASAYFKRRFHLPDNIARDKIFMDYKNEILSFDLLKSLDQSKA
ncbi:Hsp20/alpha crystallin family protein [Yeosuana marina]|uniref:Hsp20/alpha crystallin family protein n=1 Tax=Yeosuana marina TaxID=1565536 RepID=UPI0030C84FB2